MSRSTSSRRLFTAVVVAAALVAALPVAQAFAGSQDLRSPDTRDAAVGSTHQDLRSPDTRDAAVGSTHQDLRSPDTRDVGRPVASVPAVTTREPSDEFPWSLVVVGGAMVLLVGGVGIGLRRHHVASATAVAR